MPWFGAVGGRARRKRCYRKLARPQPEQRAANGYLRTALSAPNGCGVDIHDAAARPESYTVHTTTSSGVKADASGSDTYPCGTQSVCVLRAMPSGSRPARGGAGQTRRGGNCGLLVP